MILYLTLDSLKLRYQISFWWFLLLFPIVAVIHFIDKKYIYPAEMDATARAVPFNRSLVDKLDRILKILEEKA